MSMFSVDSKLTNVLSYIADIVIINLIFLVCCLPIFTIGAAQAGLYTAMRQMINPNDDRSCIKAFFRGFASGFGRISLVHTVFLMLEVIAATPLIFMYAKFDTGLFDGWFFPVVAIIGLLACLQIQSLLPVFHARFSCGPFQLIRNCVLLFISHPLRSLAVMALTWAPVALALINPRLFMDLSALFITVYYSVAFIFGAYVMIKPFKKLIDEIEVEDEKEIEEVEEEEKSL